MKHLLFLFVYAAAVLILLSSCASRIDADYGTSYKLTKINQIINPDAEKNLAPVYGVSGIVAQNIMEKYEAGFKECKTAAPSYTFNVGEIAAGQ